MADITLHLDDDEAEAVLDATISEPFHPPISRWIALGERVSSAPQQHAPRRYAPWISRAARASRAGRLAPGAPVARSQAPGRNAAHCPGRPPSVKGTRGSFLTASQKRSSGSALEHWRPLPTQRA